MKKKLYIHIGPHKTGTTSIQSGLILNEEKLKQHRVLHPISGRPLQYPTGNHNLAWELIGHDHERFNPKSGTWKDLLKEINKTHKINKIIISSEDFSTLSSREIARIKNQLRNYDIKVVLYLRRQDKVLHSLWVEIVKNPYSPKQVAPFFNWVQKNNYYYSLMDYPNIISNWADVFQNENITISLIDPYYLKQPLFFDFLSKCEIKNYNFNLPKKANISPSDKPIEAIRMVKENIDFSEISTSTWNDIVTNIIEFGKEQNWSQKANYLTEEISQRILKYYGETNMNIAQEFFW